MKTVTIKELSNYARNKLMTVGDTAAFLNFFFPEMVNEFLEAYTMDFTDLEMIVEMTNQLNLPLTLSEVMA